LTSERNREREAALDTDDSCPAVDNPDQEEFDCDGRGGACDENDDGDGLLCESATGG
jgi:hypothetical protein